MILDYLKSKLLSKEIAKRKSKWWFAFDPKNEQNFVNSIDPMNGHDLNSVNLKSWLDRYEGQLGNYKDKCEGYFCYVISDWVVGVFYSFDSVSQKNVADYVGIQTKCICDVPVREHNMVEDMVFQYPLLESRKKNERVEADKLTSIYTQAHSLLKEKGSIDIKELTSREMRTRTRHVAVID